MCFLVPSHFSLSFLFLLSRRSICRCGPADLLCSMKVYISCSAGMVVLSVVVAVLFFFFSCSIQPNAAWIKAPTRESTCADYNGDSRQGLIFAGCRLILSRRLLVDILVLQMVYRTLVKTTGVPRFTHQETVSSRYFFLYFILTVC